LNARLAPIEIVRTFVHILDMKIAGVEWDHGNWPKCGKHGVSKDSIEYALRHMKFRIPDPNPAEARYRTASRAPDGRPVFIVYTHRQRDGKTWLRPVTARYMHGKEVRQYEQIEKAMADPA
jgi:uncharacterized protein